MFDTMNFFFGISSKAETSPQICGSETRITNILRLRIVARGEQLDRRWVVQVCHKKRRNNRWRDFSAPFKSESEATGFINSILRHDEMLGKKVFVFLESLMHYAEDEGVESLFAYVRDMIAYFYRCFVENRCKVTIQFVSQMDDMGDEYFDCVHCVNKELGLQNSNFRMQMTTFSEPDCVSGKNPQTNAYLSTGSNCHVPLRLFWEVDLEKVRL